MALKKAGGSWVEGDKFFDRDVEIELLTERVRNGTHTLLTAQRRMGKTSLIRELQRRLRDDGRFETIFVDLEDARNPADAIADIGVESRSAHGVWRRITSRFSDTLRSVGDRIETLEVFDVRAKLRAGIDDGNWRQRGDEIFAALAENDRLVVLAIDELPMLVNRLLKGDDHRITPQRRQAVDEFLSWLRKNGQAHQGRIAMILSGSVSLEPILRQAGFSAHVNIFSPFDLKPWDEETAVACLGALAETYHLDLPLDARRDMCHRLRCRIPHHVQEFFDTLHTVVRRAGRCHATLEDVEREYTGEMLGPRGQLNLEHYEGRLRMVLGDDDYPIAIELLTEAAVTSGVLRSDVIDRYHEHVPARAEAPMNPIEYVLYVLEHDGYLERYGDGYRFVSGLLEDWWRAGHARYFTPIHDRRV